MKHTEPLYHNICRELSIKSLQDSQCYVFNSLQTSYEMVKFTTINYQLDIKIIDGFKERMIAGAWIDAVFTLVQ